MCRTPLKNRIPPNYPQRGPLSIRNSPQLSINILDVSILAAHGHSGGPLLVKDVDPVSGIVHDKVIGIVIGGLPINIANAWAVPWPDVDLIPIEQVRAEIDELAAQSLSETLSTP
jgi:hypothetical protein